MKKCGLSKTTWLVCSSLVILAVVLFLIFYFSGGLSFSPPKQDTYFSCVNNACTLVEGVGVNECHSEGSFCCCIDTDIEENYPSGMNFFLQGTARNSTLSQTDFCSANGRLVEYACYNNEISNFEIACESLGDYACVSGECFPDHLEFEDCEDSDGGLDYNAEGRAFNGKVRLADYCTGDGKLAEIYCSQDNEGILIQIFDCSTLRNSICEYGKCVSAV